MRVSIIGHREVQDKENLFWRISETVFELIENEGADFFYFGGKGEFDALCCLAVTRLQELFPHIKTVYVSAGREEQENSRGDALNKNYNETYYPDSVRGSNKLCYVIRNVAMIEVCDVLLTYCDTNYEPPQRKRKSQSTSPTSENKKPKSGTQMAVEFAKKRKKRIINLFER